jgi:lysophospholipid acyltransferase (LPLAT)-like uncharacterized protein
MPTRPVRFAWLARLFGRALAAYARLVAATSRPHGPPITQDQVVFAIWHEANLAAMSAALRLRDNPRVVSFSTRGFRGIVMNTMLEALGGGFVALPDEGQHTRGEAGRLSLDLARVGRDGDSVVVSCDGPLGPYRAAKPGVLLVAREAGLPIQPWAVAIRPAVRLRGRWDRQLLPLPFGRIRIEQGDPITVAPREPLKPKLALLQAALDEVAERADRRMTRTGPAR